MKSLKLFSVLIAVSTLSGCGAGRSYDTYSVSAEPYSAFTDENVRNLECRINLGDEVFVSGSGAWLSGGDILISEGGVYIITGSYNCGGINVSTNDAVKLLFTEADISNPNGCAVVSSSEKLVIACDSGESTITGCGGEHDTAVYSEGTVMFVGMGGLLLDGGVFSEGGIHFSPTVSTYCEIYRTDEGELISDCLSINRVN